MPKKKIKEKRIHFLLDKIRYDKLLKCAGEYNTLTDILNKSIDGYYFSVFKTNEVIDTSIPQNKKIVSDLQKQSNSSVNKTDLDDAKAAFIARRNAKKEGDSNA